MQRRMCSSFLRSCASRRGMRSAWRQACALRGTAEDADGLRVRLDPQDRVQTLATKVASWYTSSLVESYAPIDTLAALIEANPGFSAVSYVFGTTAPVVVAKVRRSKAA